MLSDPMKDAVRYIKYRMRSRKEIEDQLLKKGYSQEEVDEVIEKLEEQKLVDDRVFASLYVSDGLNVHHKGPFRIRQELFKLGILEEIISDSIEKELENCDLKEIAKIAIGSTERTDADKMRRKLYRKGFSSSLIDEVIDEIDEKS
ncbi:MULTISPECIES: regulatory protein RecX [Mesotoga]|uniref:regulatory protein RecX n=1 Tax=Mesotoga TaxID=1184396 RepID=UPI000EF15788|nr:MULTISPECIES: RecX family transcriptional regulator [Mesotoga]MCP5456373.1 RecX family transcriptional regulator [Thermotogota bacterium]MCB1222471.1 RecX family transcriptional regulator [Mesotoga sp.]MCP5460902.1 RecX family transcriptional regulator [Thermotogota bacterium]RLL88254.1 RecX family transcriptional regulator [Mesotoga sp. H07pep.5.4]HNQ70369.1 RecX family transcriptional regulator [Mesotoga prima]